MKHSLVLLLFLLSLLAQAQPPVRWQASSKRINDTTYQLAVNGTIAEGWHVYASNAAEELDAPSLAWDLESVQPAGASQTSALLHTVADPVFDHKKLKVYKGEVSLLQRITIRGTVPSELRIFIRGFAANGSEFTPIEESRAVSLEGGSSHSATLKLSTIDLNSPVVRCGEESAGGKGLLAIYLLGFAGGLIALLTPCVFPMVPVTVSFFTNRAANRKQAVRNGILYGVFIFSIYALASLPFHLLSDINPEIFNTLSTNAWVNVFFFVVFIVFALSFFGFFELTLPAHLTTVTDAKSGLGSIGGIFFMALTLALVSFSCTGPILGSLLVGSLSSNGGAWQLTAGMGGFGTALALPFALFAMFPNWLKTLPKSGGWLDTVKKVLAFVEVALAFKFLSNADLVMHWGLLKREVFMGIWLVTSLALSAYLLGWLHLPHDHSGQKVSVGRKVLGAVALLFALYLVPGLTDTKYANLKLLSGFPPPLSYSVYGLENVHGKGLEPQVINDYEKALALSRAQNKPLLIDFTGWACVNCRKMEEQVWTRPEIASLIREQFVLVSLYVDDRQKLPADKQFTYRFADGKEKDIRTLCDRWATFQAENFSQVSQPLYVVLSPEGQLMNKPVGYTPDQEAYRQWLECALEASRKNDQLGSN
jgi:thiol:disulfide interchange protein